MADADEDTTRSPATGAEQIETDLSDETQDFRLLNHLNFLTDTSNSSLPRRGEKDFEPNPTEFQADVLSASRQAMHNALSYPRIHAPKNQVVAFYSPDGPIPPPAHPVREPLEAVDEYRKTSNSEPKTNPSRVSEKGVGVSAEACVCVPSPKGTYFKSMGQADRWNRIWLLPEEALYMLERGSLDIRWPQELTGSVDELSIPMSLQAAYTCFIGRGGLTLERFSVYTGLKRLGYALIRGPGWDDQVDEASNAQDRALQLNPTQRGPGLGGIFSRLFEWIHDPLSTASTTTGPVVGCGIHRSYADVYRKLAIIPWYDPVTPQPNLEPSAPFRVVYHIYKPSTSYKKTAPPPPDFRIAVLSTREQSTLPTLTQLSALLHSTPLVPPHGEKMNRMMYMRLRHGYRNVILAIVDQGVVSYLRVGDAAFGKEKLFENVKPVAGTKRSGFSKKSKGS
ncbi:uncharacterized protein PFLUO_LOCUS7412 [Penicillium psychrofluorescens]|uniref:uncharacterized protein n=1 Tax=Penicillium psychrofluorescens TaxID=3158075 RepID=UPI003CCE0F92